MNISIPLKGEVIQMVQLPPERVILQILFKGLKIKVSVSNKSFKTCEGGYATF